MLLLNPDTQVKSGAIERLMSFMDAHPDAGVAGAQLLNSDGSKQNSIANFPSLGDRASQQKSLEVVIPERVSRKGEKLF